MECRHSEESAIQHDILGGLPCVLPSLTDTQMGINSKYHTGHFPTDSKTHSSSQAYCLKIRSKLFMQPSIHPCWLTSALHWAVHYMLEHRHEVTNLNFKQGSDQIHQCSKLGWSRTWCMHMQTWVSSCGIYTSHPRVMAHFCNPGTREVETAGFLVLIGQLVRTNHVPVTNLVWKINVDNWKVMPDIDLWPPHTHVYTCTYIHSICMPYRVHMALIFVSCVLRFWSQTQYLLYARQTLYHPVTLPAPICHYPWPMVTKSTLRQLCRYFSGTSIC